MDDIPFYRRPWFYIASWMAILLIAYGWQISRMGGIRSNLRDIFVDLICIFPVLLVMWLAFFAQFVLPVQTFQDRQKIFLRLILYLFGKHGPALFIENGTIKEHSGERLKKGPGVLWLDSASAAVIRTAVAIKRTIGPGVHFTKKGEYLAGSLDLHNQVQSLGPREDEKPFAPEPEEKTEEPEYETKRNKYEQTQKNRMMVSALTRDGIEVLCNITVVFRVDTKPPEKGHPGSLFGYRTGNENIDRENEEKDKKAIEKAIVFGEGINPTTTYYHVAWNRLPALLAVDVWREYVEKFTLDELFKQDQKIPYSPPLLSKPTEDEIDALTRPIQMGPKPEGSQDVFVAILRILNKMLTAFIKWLENENKVKEPATSSTPSLPIREPDNTKPQVKTALQVINDMVKDRLTLSTVDFLDKHGRRKPGTVPSKEYHLLQQRGVKVLNVSIGNLQFDNLIEEQFIRQWTASWLNNARAERDQIDRQCSYIETGGQQQAIRQYAKSLSHELMTKRPANIKDTLKTLILRSGFELNRDQLRRMRIIERQEIEDIIKWVEMNTP